jgi:hypothetical protein
LCEQASCSTQLFTQGHKFRLSRQAAQLSFIVVVDVIVIVIAGFSVFSTTITTTTIASLTTT